MNAPQPPTTRPSPQPISLALAGLLAGLGAITVLAWWLQIDGVLVPFGVASAPPLPINAALGFVALAAALLGAETQRRGWLAVAGVALLLGAASLAQTAAGLNLGVDQLFSADHLGAQAPHPGRMSVVLAATLFSAGGMLLWRIAASAVSPATVLAAALIGSAFLSLGLAVLIGHGVALPALHSPAGDAPTGVVGGGALLLLGLALLVRAWRDGLNGKQEAPAWLPVPAVAVCLTLSFAVWAGLTSSERRHAGVALVNHHQSLPEFALLAGLGISALLGLSVHLARRARADQRAAESSNARLLAENEERRRVEARLQISEERLRLALDSSQVGIVEWHLATGRAYYSPALWFFLGYDPEQQASTPEVWSALIHPDDLDGYRRALDPQLAGAAPFVEAEYRVRTREGSWRWVCSRTKSVAFGADGRPTQIVGTVQDVTARRTAEEALRESQADARKLSLVAAKTDNPVLIGLPDGRIEWANEAFCRLVERPLEGVFGQLHTDFMTGPETDPKTVARIRAAIARGQGISTDAVHYARSGRHYHLHIEIQPVRNAAGDIENFITVGTDITARVDTEQQLRRAKAEADEASRAKSEFLASMSHEIRTPMNGVIGMTSLLLETPLNAEQRDFVNTVRTSGEALLTIINDILDFSKIESGKMDLERTPFELAVCIEEALDLFALQAAAKKIELGYLVAPEVPAWIIGDVTRVRQVIVNLVNNAVKFTPGGSISVEVRRAAAGTATPGFSRSATPFPADTVLEFTVRDTGIGIPPDRIDRLFRAFSQVDSSTTRKYGGTGLGLAICHRLCELMGGRIRVESRIGHGSSFIFTIGTRAAPEAELLEPPAVPPSHRGQVALCIEDNPVTAARLHATFEKWGVGCMVVADAATAVATAARLAHPPLLVVADAAGDDNAAVLAALTTIPCPRVVLHGFGSPPPAAAADGQPFAATTKPVRHAAFAQCVARLFAPAATINDARAAAEERPLGVEIPLEILLAEDNPVNQKVALRFLERMGYRADAVANGLEAVHTLEHRFYDLVLMDLQMPEMDGFEATRQIRARLPKDRQPRIVALTANAMQGDREMCLATGMDDYISKPVKIHEITESIRRLFGPRATPPPARRPAE